MYKYINVNMHACLQTNYVSGSPLYYVRHKTKQKQLIYLPETQRFLRKHSFILIFSAMLNKDSSLFSWTPCKFLTLLNPLSVQQ